MKFIYIKAICLSLLCLSSCQLAEDLDDIKPLYTLDAETAIVDESTAELALAGVYAGFRQSNNGSGNPEIYLIPGLMSGMLVNHFVFNNGPEGRSYVANNPLSDATNANIGAYTRMYDLINRTNWFIEKTSELSESEFSSPDRKTTMIAEAKAIRATANFLLLRLWGQFYDSSSKYGIVLRKEPARSAEALPRSSVQETYDAIIEDLDAAIASAPDLRAKYFINKTYAKGLKAKVMLYKGEYATAASMAKDVIDNSGPNFELEANYGDIFLDHETPDLFSSSEVLFAPKGEPGAILGIGNFTGFWASINPTFSAEASKSTTIDGQTIVHDGTRLSSTIYNSGFFGYDTYKYNTRSPGQLYEMVYLLRMAEIYLIYAEADARASNSVTSEALNALNTIRVRAGATSTGNDGFETYPASISLSQFLEAVRIEKQIELAVETGEEWFDLVRYHFIDGFDVTTVKSTATIPDKFILPIDAVSIQSGGGVVEQNPSY
ncbi:RagB/SusD family nutrient uptake outer membrane protein [Aestuariivivens sp. NBU2969]|uniref:RagB/SusD family nutrient uptake outer membrane protein n=1 Tax=Aestuariivivens sp. NBU2969 TaxID=2873267 RepID=UPI001CBCBD58|nr:RagB/SusD family nutrient uptake outer membrane protein [Aestuariivivens sp. NBU2969]